MSNADRNTHGSKRLTIAISLFIIATCVGLGIYALQGGSGNILSAADTHSSGASCSLAVAEGAKLNEFARGDMAAFSSTDRPVDFSTIAFLDGDGVDRTIADWRGKTLFVNLWATWCGPCRHEMPSINAMQRDLASDDFEVIALSLDQGGAAKPLAFLDEIQASSLSLYQDNTNEVFLDLREKELLTGLPASYLIDKNGCLLGSLLGPAEWMSPDAQNLLQAARK